MRQLIIIACFGLLLVSAVIQKPWPDLSKKEDLKTLGMGRIVETDGSIFTKIILEEVNDYSIVYIKNESLHDMAIDKINRMEFNNTKWGPLKIEFNNGKPIFSLLDH